MAYLSIINTTGNSMKNDFFSFKHITNHPSLVNPNILRVIKYGEQNQDTFETHYVHIDVFNRLNQDQPEDGVEFQKWLDAKADGHPLIFINTHRVKELIVGETFVRAIVHEKRKGFHEIGTDSIKEFQITTAFDLRQSVRESVLKQQEKALELQINQLIASM